MSKLDPLVTFDEKAMRCPYLYARPEPGEPELQWSETAQHWVAMSYRTIREILRDTGTFSNANMTGGQDDEVGELSGYGSEGRDALLFADPPRHTRHRALISGAFTPAKVARMEDLFTELAGNLCGQAAERLETEFLGEFALPFTTTVICDVIGLPREMVPTITRWALEIGVTAGGTPNEEELARLEKARVDFDEYFLGQVEQRRARRTDDLLSDIIYAEIEGMEPLTTGELLSIIQATVIGGLETSAHMLGSIVYRLAREPELWQRMRQAPDLIPELVEEMLRLDGSSIGVYRTITKDVALAGQQLKAGQMVYLSWAAANFDPTVFDEPEELRLDRGNVRRHLTFGAGAHFCVGVHVARAELRIALTTILRRFERVELVEGKDIPYARSLIFHGPKTLWVRFS